MTGNPTAPRCIWPRTSSPSSRSRRAAQARLFRPRDPPYRPRIGFLITEDFGTEGVVEGDPPQPIAERYEAATDMLAALHRETLPETLPLTPHESYAIPVYDIDAWLVEISLMIEWYLPDRGVTLSDDARAEFVAMWRELLEKPAAAPRPG